MVTINNLSVEFSSKPLFTGISFVVNDTDKIALTGRNGAGKSTLLKILAGIEHPTSGVVSLSERTSVGYLPQQMKVADDTTVIEEVRKAFSKAVERKLEIDRVTAELAAREDYDSEEYHKLINHLEYLNERAEMEDVAHMEAEMERTLLGLGLKRTDFNRPTSEFSGGWRMRIELAKILLQRPELLLLDEPTNHLDIESIAWLENFLKTKAKSVVLVSHDKAFIDNVTSRTIEISCGKIYDYKVNYSHFLELRKERVEQQRRAYENQQKQIADIKDFIERFRYKPTKAVQVQSRIKQLEKIVPIEIDQVDNSRVRLKFPPAARCGDFPLIIDGLAKSYGSHKVIGDVNLTLRRGEKVAFVGRNGEGKSTLVKCIMGEIGFDGDLKIGHNVSIGYFAQNQAQLLDGDITVFDTIDRVATGDIRTKIKDILGAFMFGGPEADKYVKVLSGGEKTRLAMIKLLLEPVNFLILDEPTNHLDIATKSILKDAIKDFDGTVIVVSHDRDFLDGLVDKVYEFADGKVRENLGGITDFLARHGLSKEGMRAPKEPKASEQAPEDSAKSLRKLSYEEQKEREKAVRRARKEVERLENEIERLEGELAAIEKKLSEGDASEATLNMYAETKDKLEAAMTAWEEATAEYEGLKTE